MVDQLLEDQTGLSLGDQFVTGQSVLFEECLFALLVVFLPADLSFYHCKEERANLA